MAMIIPQILSCYTFKVHATALMLKFEHGLFCHCEGQERKSTNSQKKFFNELKTTYLVSHNLQVRGKEYLSTQARKAHNSCFMQAEPK